MVVHIVYSVLFKCIGRIVRRLKLDPSMIAWVIVILKVIHQDISRAQALPPFRDPLFHQLFGRFFDGAMRGISNCLVTYLIINYVRACLSGTPSRCRVSARAQADAHHSVPHYEEYFPPLGGALSNIL